MSLDIFRNGIPEQPFNARVLPPIEQPATDTPADVEVAWGGPSSSNYHVFVWTARAVNVLTEQDRVTDTVRVTNPQDSSQFVDVERIRQLRLGNEFGQQFTFVLNP